MTNVFLHDASHAAHAAAVVHRLAGAMPSHATISTREDAEIIIAVDGVSTHDAQSTWLLLWGDATPFTRLRELRAAVCQPYACMTLNLVTLGSQGYQLLRQAAFATIPGQFAATKEQAQECAVNLITQALVDLENNALTTVAFSATLQPPVLERPPFCLASWWWRSRLAWRWGVNTLTRLLTHESWMIGWIDAPISAALSWKTCPPVRWIGSRTPNSYLADPFAWPKQNQRILCEAYDWATGLGQIRQLTLDGTTISDDAAVRFPLDGHMSYPFLFEHEGGVYCLPETCAARRLTIYRWDEAQGWGTMLTPLTDIAAADSILFKHGGYFWIAYTDTEIDRFDNLNLCYAASLAGPWRLHANNPVRRDPRNARCGGTPFQADGKLYRPAQDCVPCYGAALRIMEIVTCTPTQYVEREVTMIVPATGLNPHGLHTLSACGDKCLVDGKRMLVSPRQVLHKIFRRLIGRGR
jgi:hypothetical protein